MHYQRGAEEDQCRNEQPPARACCGWTRQREIALQQIDRVRKCCGRGFGPAPCRTAHERDTRLALPAREIGVRHIGFHSDLHPNFHSHLRRRLAVASRMRERQGQLHRQSVFPCNRRHRKRAAVGAAYEAVARTRGAPAPSAAGQREIGFCDHTRHPREGSRVRRALTQRRNEWTRRDYDAHASAGRLRRHSEMLRILRSSELVVERECRGRRDACRGQRRKRQARDPHLRRGKHGFDAIRRRPGIGRIATGAHASVGVVEQCPRLRTSARRRRVDQHSKRRHAQEVAAIMRDSLLDRSHGNYSMVCQITSGQALARLRRRARARASVAPCCASIVT